GRRYIGDVSHLSGEIRRHEIHIVGEILPRAGDLWHQCLSAESALRAYFARNASHFFCEGAQLVHHGVDGVLQLEDLAFDIDRDLAREIAFGDRGGDVGNVSDLTGQV